MFRKSCETFNKPLKSKVMFCRKEKEPIYALSISYLLNENFGHWKDGESGQMQPDSLPCWKSEHLM